jgi:hypothetical protein
MKTIEKAAKEWANGGCYFASVRDYGDASFRAGVEYAQQWISVNDKLPEENIPVLTKIEFLDETGKVMEEETTYLIACYDCTINQWITNLHYYFPDEIYAPTHWRRIEL